MAEPDFGEVDMALDEQLYEHKRRCGYDPHDDDEWDITLTARQWRIVERALAIANEMTPPSASTNPPSPEGA